MMTPEEPAEPAATDAVEAHEVTIKRNGVILRALMYRLADGSLVTDTPHPKANQ